MTSSRPYLLRALYEWIVDNDHVPYIVVDAQQPGVVVPPEHVKDGQILSLIHISEPTRPY